MGFSLSAHLDFFICFACQFAVYKFDISAGYSWSLYKCENCEQLYAEPRSYDGGFLPKEVILDKSIIRLEPTISIKFDA